MNRIKKIYQIIYKAYGPQGWWPLTERYRFIPVHKGKKPSTKQIKFEIIIGAILTQNTAWKNVEKALIELNKRRLLDIKKLKSLPANKLGAIIKPSGYYNQKAKKIKAMIEFLELGKDVNRENLLSIWGIGPETADSILLYAYEQPFFVIDAYTKRIFSRLGLAHKNASYKELQKMFHKALPKDVEMFKEYHALLVEHGKRYCRIKPLCEECVLRRECNYAK
ncbi:hypothetical protein AYK26_06740 [Euryarchaeota archaeon SM23-78]|nr:MAG: hypothetical protein AYK26_06740 [Euryarchaeota archaeon SM23-78]MBW3001185.1 endonuclease [Candidatus Woesearchaeota archaeon]